ncbi:MAG: ATP-binding protein [Pirellulales bacterium]
MLHLVEALNFRCLRYVSQRMDRFHVLVGPNASGKTTFLDVIAFMSGLVKDGLPTTVGRMSPTFDDLLFRHEGKGFELAIEVKLPETLKRDAATDVHDVLRYEVAIELDSPDSQMRIAEESLLVRQAEVVDLRQPQLFPESRLIPTTLLQGNSQKLKKQTILRRTEKGRANYYPEPNRKGWKPKWDLAAGSSALANLPEDHEKFPSATWFKRFLLEGIEKIQLDSVAIQKASPPGQGTRFKRDGSNLPWVVHNFRQKNPQRFKAWLDHLQTALRDLEDVVSVDREDDRHRYLKLEYKGGLEVPSWMASDGTLRLLALTLPAYLDDLTGVLLIEEPENGIHPRAVETMIESLRDVDNAQILVATHSPVVLSNVQPSEVLCFAKDPEGATDIVRGSEHPALVDWQRDISLGTLFAAGVLN